MASSAPAKFASIPRGNNLSYRDLEALWVQAGGNRYWAPIMAAVALAESKGDRMAHRVVPTGPNREDSRGPWQINVYAHPQYARTNLYDPATNARAAVAVFNDSGPGAWSTYKDGSYKQSLQAARGHGGGGFLQRLPGGIAHGVIAGVVPGANLIPPLPHIPTPSDVAGAITGGVHDVEQFVEQKSLIALGYLVFTAVALFLFAQGAKSLTGVSPGRLAAERVSAASEPGASQGEGIPF